MSIHFKRMSCQGRQAEGEADCPLVLHSGLSPALTLCFVSSVTSQSQRNERIARNLKPTWRNQQRQGDPKARLGVPVDISGEWCFASCGARPFQDLGSACSAVLATVVEAGFPRLCNGTSRACRDLGFASRLRRAPGLRQPSHGLGGGGGGGELRGQRRALGAHAPVRSAARTAGPGLLSPGQLRRRAGLARPGWVRSTAAGAAREGWRGPPRARSVRPAARAAGQLGAGPRSGERAPPRRAPGGFPRANCPLLVLGRTQNSQRASQEPSLLFQRTFGYRWKIKWEDAWAKVTLRSKTF